MADSQATRPDGQAAALELLRKLQRLNWNHNQAGKSLEALDCAVSECSPSGRTWSANASSA